MGRSEQKVVQYLEEAHASEVALTRVLQSQIAMTPRGTVRSALEGHLDETRSHAERLRDRLQELGAGRNPLQIAVGLTETVVGQALALTKTPIDLVRGTGGEEKVLKNAKDAVATEALEIATYTALEALASAVGDERTRELAAAIRRDEEAMLERLLREIPALTAAVVRADVEGDPSFDPTTTGAGEAVAAARDAVGDAAEDAGESARAAKDAVGARADAVRDAARDAKDAAGARAGKARSAASRKGRVAGSKARAGARRVPGATKAEGTAKGAVATAGDLPIARYDELTAEQVDARLPKLSQVELAKVAAYERLHEDRKTVTERVARLQGDEPWAGYDEQTAAKITAALTTVTDAQARAARDYERDHKARAGVTKAIEKRLGPAA